MFTRRKKKLLKNECLFKGNLHVNYAHFPCVLYALFSLLPFLTHLCTKKMQQTKYTRNFFYIYFKAHSFQWKNLKCRALLSVRYFKGWCVITRAICTIACVSLENSGTLGERPHRVFLCVLYCITRVLDAFPR